VSSTGADVTVYSIDGKSFEKEDVYYSDDPVIELKGDGLTFVGIKGRYFDIPETYARDCFGKELNGIIGKVYYDYYGNSIDVTVADGRFLTEKNGVYRIVFTVKDAFGNVGVKSVSVSCVDSYSDIGVSVPALYRGVGEVATNIPICPESEVEITNALGVTEIKRAVYRTDGTERIPAEISGDSLYTLIPGSYYVEYTVTDGTQRVKTDGYYINVTASSDYVVISPVPTFVGFVRGNSYEIPEIRVVDYSGGGANETIADVYVNGDLYTDGILTLDTGEPEEKDADETVEYVTIEYRCGAYTVMSYEVPVKTVYKTDVRQLPSGREITYTKFMQDRFFISENGGAHRVISSGMVLSSLTDEGKISFVQPLSCGKLSFDFDVSYIKTFEKDDDGRLIRQDTNVNAFKITLTDVKDRDKVLVIYLTTNQNTGYAVACAGGAISQDISASFVGISSEQFSIIYDNASGKITDAVTGTQILSPKTYENGKRFTGFSDVVYVSFSFECKTEGESAEMTLYSINSQSFSSLVNKDMGEPNVTVDGKLNGVFRLGEKITIPSAKAADVFGSVIGNGTFTVSVVLEKDGGSVFVKDADGHLLKDVSPYRSYEIVLSEVGNYKVTYFAQDSNGVPKESVFAVTVVHDNKPVIKLNGTLPDRVDRGKPVTIPTANVEFYGKESSGTVYVYAISPDYQIEIVKGNAYVFDKVGTYTIRYFALDAYGNYEMTDHVVSAVG
ncbi:MAG: hypothetical protein J5697_00835, partial [Clostridia bacterium]|nr:hypothetical protein [Clostridia bacterium]